MKVGRTKEKERTRNNPEGKGLTTHQRLLKNKLLLWVMLEGKNVDRRRTECIGFSWPPERWHHWHPPVRMGSLLMPKWGAGNPKHFMAPSGRNTNGGEEESNLFDSRLPEFSSSPCGDCYPPQNLPGGWLLCHYRSQNLGSQN